MISNRRPNQWAAGLSTVRRIPWITHPLPCNNVLCRGGGQKHRRGTLDPHFRPHVAEVSRVSLAPPSIIGGHCDPLPLRPMIATDDRDRTTGPAVSFRIDESVRRSLWKIDPTRIGSGSVSVIREGLYRIWENIGRLFR